MTSFDNSDEILRALRLHCAALPEDIQKAVSEGQSGAIEQYQQTKVPGEKTESIIHLMYCCIYAPVDSELFKRASRIFVGVYKKFAAHTSFEEANSFLINHKEAFHNYMADEIGFAKQGLTQYSSKPQEESVNLFINLLEEAFNNITELDVKDEPPEPDIDGYEM